MQGSIYYADLNPVIGSEQNGVRPVVVISGDAMNNNFGICVVCPLTTSKKNYPGSVKIKPNSFNGLREPSQILTFQIRTISKKRILEKIGVLEPILIEETKKALFDVLTY